MCFCSLITGSPAYKLVVVDVDPIHKSEREEWGTARYHGNYCPTTAFELEVHWLVATGCILEDLVRPQLNNNFFLLIKIFTAFSL